MKYSLVIVLGLFLLTAAPVHAMPKDGCGGDCASCHKLTVQEANKLMTGVGKVLSVKYPSIRGLWELEVEKDGKKAVAYLDYGKKHLVPGPVYNLATKQPITGGAPPAPKLTKVKVSAIPVDNSLVMGNPAGKKRLIVFTDPECPYCAKLHGELTTLVGMDKEVAVFIKLFPLKIHPNARAKADAIMQGKSLQLLADAYAGKPLPPPGSGPQAGAAVVEETIAMASRLGINSTPTLIFPDGSVTTGSMAAADIQKMLSAKARAKR
jgi:thiol:disulfide interchange protein DsbC